MKRISTMKALSCMSSKIATLSSADNQNMSIIVLISKLFAVNFILDPTQATLQCSCIISLSLMKQINMTK
jgi:hypothetical protein